MKLRYGLLTLLYCAMIFALSSRSQVPDVGFSIPHLDKLAHAVIYAGLVFVVSVGLRRSGVGTRGGWSFAGPILFAVFFGISDEIHQAFVPYRNFDIFDLLADGLGALAMQTLLWQWWGRKARQVAEATPR